MAATRRAGLWLPPLVYVMAIYYLSSQSDPLPVLTANVWDKFLHAAEYGGLGILVCRALIGEGVGWIRAALIAVVVSSAYAATDEWHQSFVELRSADVQDWLTDNVGATIGAGSYAMIAAGRRPKK
jgi:VanZ family protein